MAWAELLRGVFATDALSCPYGGRRSVIAVVVDFRQGARGARDARAAVHTGDVHACASSAQGELWFDDAS